MKEKIRGAIVLVGLGRRPDCDPTLDALDALSTSEIALCIGLDDTALALVRRVATDVRPFIHRDTLKARKALRALLDQGRRVAWIGLGHPAEIAPLPEDWSGASFRVAKGVSELDSHLAVAQENFPGGRAYYPGTPQDAFLVAHTASDPLSRADWPASPRARAAKARRLVAAGASALAHGGAEDAARALYEAASLAPHDDKIWLLYGRALLLAGRPNEAWRALWKARVHGAPKALTIRPLDAALKALGRPGESSAARARRTTAGAARAALARAEALTAAGDLVGARAALDAAVAAEPAAEIFAARGRWAARYGLPMENISDFREALDLEPTPARRLTYANALRHAKFHDLARVELDRAVGEPRAPGEAFRQRGLARLRTGDWRGAAADADAARKRGSSAADLLWLRAESAAASGSARRHIAPALADATACDAAWIEGYVALAENHPDPTPFERSASLAANDPQSARRARVYAALARAWNWHAPVSRMPGLSLCGLGISPPRSPTAEVIAVLRSCDVVFQNSSSDPLGPLLRLLCPRIRPSTFHHEFNAPELVEEMLSEVRRGRCVGFATFGHPMLFGPLAVAALARAKREGLPARVYAAPSSLGEMLSAGAALGPVAAPQVLVGVSGDSVSGAAEIDPTAPLLLYPAQEPPPPGEPCLLDVVAARYPAGHRAIVLEPDEKDWDRPRWMTLDELARLPASVLAQRLVFVPAC